jgi:hypothetical protein
VKVIDNSGNRPFERGIGFPTWRFADWPSCYPSHDFDAYAYADAVARGGIMVGPCPIPPSTKLLDFGDYSRPSVNYYWRQSRLFTQRMPWWV